MAGQNQLDLFGGPPAPVPAARTRKPAALATPVLPAEPTPELAALAERMPPAAAHGHLLVGLPRLVRARL